MSLRTFTLPFIGFLILLSGFAQAQQPVNRDSSRLVQLRRANVYGYLKKDSLNELQKLVGDVFLVQDRTEFYCDSAVRNMKTNVLEAFGKVHINDSDSIHTYSDYLKYFGNEKKAILKKKVKLTDGKGVLTTEELEYDIGAKIGNYSNGGKLVNGSTTLTSKEGWYYADTRDVIFRNNVVLVDPRYTVATDTLLYNSETEVATFVSPTTINDGKSTIRTSSGYYDLKNGLAYFGKRPVIEDSTQFITAEQINFDNKTGIGEATGNFLYKDTAQGVTVLSGKGNFNRNNKTFLATVKPVMILKQDKDSLFLAADTLFSGIQIDSSGMDHRKDTLKGVTIVDSLKVDSVRFFQAYRNVRIFSDSLQAAADSMFYSLKDSVFRLYQDPVVWAQDSQLSGDTLYMYTKDKKPSRLEVFLNGFAINKTGPDHFNQIRGNTIHGFFSNGELETIRAKGNAESLYYLQDEDSAFIGAKSAVADVIRMDFQKRKLKRVSWINGVDGVLYPMSELPEEKKKIRGFRWQEGRRTKTYLDLFQ